MAVSARRRARGDSPGGGFGQFFRDTFEELRKVVWPTLPELYRYTMIVIMTVIVIGTFIGAVDFGLGKLTEKFIYSGVTHK